MELLVENVNKNIIVNTFFVAIQIHKLCLAMIVAQQLLFSAFSHGTVISLWFQYYCPLELYPFF